MEKNKRQILLMIITLLISTIIFTNKVDAIVMWMQCTDNPDDKVETNHEDFEYYNTFAIINNVENASTRHLVYNPTNFYDGFPNPVFIVYNYNGGNKNGQDVGNICWYSDVFNEMSECEINYDSLINITELYSGSCPTTVYQTEGNETSGSVKGDFVVLGGKKKANSKNIENLYESTLVIYGFQKAKDGKYVDIMVEGYNSSGLYGYATTWEDWDSFEDKINMEVNNDSNDLITNNSYSKEFMSWTGMTQARRVAKFGRNYFKLLDDSRPWLVGAVDGQELKVVETKDGKNVMYRSDDNNNNFYNWVSKWYEKYDEQLSEQIEAMKNLKSEKYQKAYNISKEISKAVDEGKKYNFDENYSPSQMVLDLNDAYKELSIILSNNESMYEYYDNECNLVTNEKTNDALGAITTQFNCELFNTASITKLKNKTNSGMLNELIVSSLSTAINKHTNSDISIETLRSTAQDYAKMYTIAIKYIKKNEILTGEAETLISTLEESYTEMSRNFGTEVIIDCEDLIGKDLREKIGSYLNIIKIAVPIILIAFGIIEFTGAIFAGDEEKMKKAQKNFLLRIGIAVLFFLTPTIVDFLLGIANKVWNFIEPGSCGIFNS